MEAQGRTTKRDQEYEELMSDYAAALINFADKWGLQREQMFIAAAGFFVWAVKEYDLDTFNELERPGSVKGNIVELHIREQDWKQERRGEKCTDGR